MTIALWLLAGAGACIAAALAASRAGDRFAPRLAVLAAAVLYGVSSAFFFRMLGPLFAALLSALVALAGASALVAITPRARRRSRTERLAVALLGAASSVAVLVTFTILLALIFESALFFTRVAPLDFLGGAAWNPQAAIRGDDGVAAGAFGVLPLVAGTLLVTAVALAIAAPVGVLAAAYLDAYASARVRVIAKSTLELLAGVPTVIYGFFALLVVGPAVRDGAAAIGALFGVDVDVTAQSALAAGLVMGVMIIPFMSSLSSDVLSAIPPTLKEGGLALGSTKAEAMLKVLLPAAAPGLIAALLLAVSRAIGETMIVVMAASRSANLTFNPLERVTTLTVQIVALLTGDQEFDSTKTLAAFALGLTLFLATLALNLVALVSVKRFRMRYE